MRNKNLIFYKGEQLTCSEIAIRVTKSRKWVKARVINGVFVGPFPDSDGNFKVDLHEKRYPSNTVFIKYQGQVYSLSEASEVFNKSRKWISNQIKNGQLVRVNSNGSPFTGEVNNDKPIEYSGQTVPRHKTKAPTLEEIRRITRGVKRGPSQERKKNNPKTVFSKTKLKSVYDISGETFSDIIKKFLTRIDVSVSAEKTRLGQTNLTVRKASDEELERIKRLYG